MPSSAALNTAINNASAHLRLALDSLRSLYPAGTSDLTILHRAIELGETSANDTIEESDGDNAVTESDIITVEALAQFMRGTVRLTSQQIWDHFNCTPQQAAAPLANLSRTGRIRKIEADPSGRGSIWSWVR